MHPDGKRDMEKKRERERDRESLMGGGGVEKGSNGCTNKRL